MNAPLVTVEVDDRPVQVARGSMLIEAAAKLGIYVPHFCYHRKLTIAANCRMCLVEVAKAPKPLPACATPVAEGMKAWTHSEVATAAQRGVMEFLLINHPLDCPICDQGGECQLQDLAVGYGASGSRYIEPKRVVVHKELGPLISAEEMTRCIHCTRCIRVGKEIGGIMELGMIGRTEHAEIVSFVGRTVDSELSGNMIDVCPVGALTSKPFRFDARTWELTRRRSVSPHDGLGANLVVQVMNDRVLRVVPFENEPVNECWISDKDRFSYEALGGDQRLTAPMIKQGGEWKEVDWAVALEFAAQGLAEVVKKRGPRSLGTLISPQATLEEMALASRVGRGLGSENVDFRLRQSDFRGESSRVGIPWLGMPIAAVQELDRVLVIGSFLRKDHPLLAHRLREAAKKGAQISSLHSIDDDWLMHIAHRAIVPPSLVPMMLAEIVVAAAQGAGKPAPAALATIEPTAGAEVIAASLLSGAKRAIFLGNYAVQHPDASQVAALAQALASLIGATLGVLTEAANTVGGYVAGAVPGPGGLDLGAMQGTGGAEACRGWLLLHAEPEFDCAHPVAARQALQKADFVAVLSPFRHGLAYADVVLPIAPFTETSGTFVNCEGRVQSFRGAAAPLGATRPGWKVLRVLGSILGLNGFDAIDTSESVRDSVLTGVVTNGFVGGLENASRVEIVPPAAIAAPVERVADVPIYFTDPLVRRAPSLQQTTDARAPKAHVNQTLLDSLGIEEGMQIKLKQGGGEAVLSTQADAGVPPGVIRVAAAHPSTCGLDGLSGPITVERA